MSMKAWFLSALKRPSWWKGMLTILVLLITVSTATIDFKDLGLWDLFQTPPPTGDTYAAKAAILALAGSATLFLAFIPNDGSPGARRADLWVRGVGAVAVGATGWFWLLSATEGMPGPYLAAYVPTLAIFVSAVVVAGVFRFAQEFDEKLIRETGRSKFDLRTQAIGGLVIVLAMAMVIGVVYVFRLVGSSNFLD